ncbi:MAG: type III pantothenate kinase [Spirochaetes bacterium]|nr:type III pantothenate kinase [Spirochaetota bacterium]
MLLAIDVGNSNIVGGVFGGAEHARKLLRTFRLRTVYKKTEDEYHAVVRAIFDEHGLSPDEIDAVVIGSVVPPLTNAIEVMARRLFKVEPLTVCPPVYPRLPVRVLAADEIGTDLVADAVAAYSRVRGACIIVDFGTALTFTGVSGDGTIMGVAIAPGLGTAVQSLSRDTAQLPDVPLSAPPSVMGTNTIQAIQSGIVFGFTGLVEGIVGRMKRDLGTEARVIATGGLCRIISPITTIFDEVDADLTLEGLAIIGDIVAGTGGA